MELHLVVDKNSPAAAVSGSVGFYTALIDARRAELERDHAYFLAKRRDAMSLDPADLTGLRGLYDAHLRHIRELLASLN